MFVSQVGYPYTAVTIVTSTPHNPRDTSSDKQTMYDKGPAQGQASASPATPSGDSNPSTGGRWMRKTFGKKWYQPVVNLYYRRWM